MGTLIIVREKHWDEVKKFDRVLLTGKHALADEIIASAIGLKEGQSHVLWFGVECPACNVGPEEHCITSSGRPARRRHKARFLLGLACMFALEDELTIMEEPEITD